MSINMNNDHNIPIDTDAYYEYYEELARQEELYLEETEEEVRLILTSYVSPASQNYRSTVIENCELRESDLEVTESMTGPKDNPHVAESLEEQILEAVEELISGDADDPPLSQEAIVVLLNDSPARNSDL